MVKKLILFICVALIAIGGASYGTYLWRQRTIDDLTKKNSDLQSQLDTAKDQLQKPQTASTTYPSTRNTEITLYTPAKNSSVTSPLFVSGKVPGNWSFEASFPLELQDEKGTIIARGTGTLLGDWMTHELVPFYATLEFTAPTNGSGALLLKKDNPSGLPENDDSVSVPVQF